MRASFFGVLPSRSIRPYAEEGAFMSIYRFQRTALFDQTWRPGDLEKLD